MSNIQKCKSCKGNLFTAPQPCITQECIQNTKCSEIIDAACIAYSGQDLLLCQEYKLISQNDNVEVALQKLFTAACENCAMSVLISGIEGSYPSLTATVTNGTGPYTYNWSIVQGPFVGHDVLGDTNLSTLDLDTIGANSILANYPITCNYLILTNSRSTSRNYTYINCESLQISFTLLAGESTEIICVQTWITPLQPQDLTENTSLVCDQRDVIKSTLVRLDVTDSIGCKKSVYYDFSCDCYVQEQDEEGIYSEYVGGNLQFLNFGMPGVNFLDRDDTTISCSELKSFGCISPSEVFVDDYKDLRNNYITSLGCILPSTQDKKNADTNCAAFLPLDYSPWEPDGIADQTIVLKGRLSSATLDFGCPEYTYWIWNNYQFACLNGDRIVDRLPTVKDHMVLLPPVDLISEIPTVGIPGEYFWCNEDNLFYAWDPTINQFSSDLGDCAIGEVLILKRQRRDNQQFLWNDLILAQQTFLLAADALPLHRYKYELI